MCAKSETGILIMPGLMIDCFGLNQCGQNIAIKYHTVFQFGSFLGKR